MKSFDIVCSKCFVGWWCKGCFIFVVIVNEFGAERCCVEKITLQLIKLTFVYEAYC